MRNDIFIKIALGKIHPPPLALIPVFFDVSEIVDRTCIVSLPRTINSDDPYARGAN